MLICLPAFGQVERLFSEGPRLQCLKLYEAHGRQNVRWNAAAEKGLALLDAGKFDAAAPPLSEAIEATCDDPMVLFAYGHLRGRAGDAREAQEFMERAEHAARNHRELLGLRQRCVARIIELKSLEGDWEGAYRAAFTWNNGDGRDRPLGWLLIRVMAFAGEEDYDLKSGVNLVYTMRAPAYPGKPMDRRWRDAVRSAVYLFAISYPQKSYYPEIKRLLADAMAKGCDESCVHGIYGFACSETGAWQEAEKHLRLAEDRMSKQRPKHPARSMVLMKLGEAAQREQHLKEALDYYRRCMIDDGAHVYPFAPEVRKRIAELEPKVVAESLLATRSADGAEGAEHLLLQAEANLKAGKTVEAVRLSAEAARLSPKSPSVLAAHLGILQGAKDFAAVEALAPSVVDLALKLKDLDALASAMTAFSLALAGDVKAYRKMPDRIKALGADKLSERAMAASAGDPRLIAAHLRIIREVFGFNPIIRVPTDIRSFEASMGLAPRGIRLACEQQRWRTACELGRMFVAGLAGARSRPRRRQDALRGVTLEGMIGVCELYAEAALRTRSGRDLAQAYKGLLWADTKYARCLGAGLESINLKRIQETTTRFRKMASEGRIARIDLMNAESGFLIELAESGDRALFDKAILFAAGRAGWTRKSGELYIAEHVNRPGVGSKPAVVEWADQIRRKYDRPTGVRVRTLSWEERYARAQVDVNEEKRRISFAASDAEKRAELTAYTRKKSDRFVAACLHTGRGTEAIEQVEWLHGASLRDLLGTGMLDRILEQTYGEDSEAGRERESAAARLGQKGSIPVGETDASGQRDLAVQANTLGVGYGALSSLRHEIRASRNIVPLSLAQIQGILDPDTTLLAIHTCSYRSTTGYHGFVAAISAEAVNLAHEDDLILPSGRLFARGPIKGRPRRTGPKIIGIRERCADFRAALQDCAGGSYGPAVRRRLEAASRALYDVLIRPVENALKGRNLVVVPSDDLYGIPFGLLVDERGTYLHERFAVSYSPSATVLKFCLDKHRPLGRRVTVLANPALADPAFHLKFAEREAATIRQCFPSANLLMGAAATPATLKTTLPESDILHFACHAVFDSTSPMDSFLALAPGQEHNGRLSAAEIMGWRTQAQVVILSACETGRGEVSPGRQEVLGMIRSWMFAGAPTVVASLWKLDDRATSELMAEFYKNLKTMGRAEALQRAQLEMMKKYETPYYWGAFVLYGDYR